MQFESSMFVTACWKRAPFLRLTIPLLTGACMQLYVPLTAVWLYILILSASAGLLCTRLLPVAYRYHFAWAGGIPVFILLYGSGALLLFSADMRQSNGYFSAATDSSRYWMARVEEPLVDKPRSRKTILAVTAVYTQGVWRPARGRLLAYFSRNSAASALTYGSVVLLAKKPVKINNNGNPGAFDYRRYCAGQQLYEQIFLKGGDYRQLARAPARNMTAWLLQARDFCLHQLKIRIGAGPEAGMAEALLIGYRQDLDPDVVSAYSNTGIVHIIAISGMHLALLYGSLLWLLRWLPARKAANALRAMILLLVLWGFALLTGASASVLRAAVMFSGITIGNLLLGRKASTYNTLAASAFVLLCYQPWLAIDAGFQLSYLAVLSILLFYDKIYQCWPLRSRWAKAIWQLAALSLAAQILTLPVSVYYFHQFPVYFLPANLLAVPLSTVVIYGEVMLLLLSPFDAPAGWAGMALHWLIHAMNVSVAWLGQLPFALVQGLQWSLLQTGCCYLLIAGLAGWWCRQYRRGYWLALAACWGMVADQAIQQINNRQRRQLIVYNVPAYTAIDVVGEGKVQFIGHDSMLSLSPIQAARTALGVKPGIVAGLYRHGRHVSFGRRQLAILDSVLPVGAPATRWRVTYVLLNGRIRANMNRVLALYDCDTVIFGAACPPYRIRHWVEECTAAGIPYYSIPAAGAKMIPF
ncbi:ComEC/Rec2 family competence protein [Chitinophaga qingshengii]|uniref:ComEC family competence protein n=1 Tax=Chitinophaga qingshengii TaxID=1569794 RepID=A0ABR7TVH6_9BACT|nr:ComEC/Rec2 family competence protein [Chitinophaga qingshengii]MBC9933655.1 ComEC family competence protein [Chitinophaga qingshengii]